MQRDLFEMHWQYYLSIEKMLLETNQYVTHVEKNKDTFSDEFTSIILLSCSELDSLFKQLCTNLGIKSKGKHFTMKDYAPILKKYESKEFGLATRIRTLNENGIHVFPFEGIDPTKPGANLGWWKDYQLIKHDRIKNITQGNLFNAVSTVATHFYILRELIEFIDENQGKSYLQKNYWTDYWIPIL